MGMVVLAVSFFYLVSFESVTLGSPIAFGDEGFHAGVPKRMAENLEIPKYFENTKIYSGAYFRPPLPHLIYAGAILVFGAADLVTKALTPLFSFFTSLMIFLIAKRLHSGRAGLIASFLYLIMPSAITHNVLVYSEAPLLFFFSMFLYTFIRYLQGKETTFMVLSGITAGFVALSKFTGLLVFPFMLVMFVSNKDWEGGLKKFFVLFAIALLIGTSSHVRQILSYDGICQPRIPAENRCYLGSAPGNVERSMDEFSGYVQKTGTNQSLMDIGVINYVQFGYTVTVFMLLIGGVFFGLLNKDPLKRSLAISGALLYTAIVSQTMNTRIEDSVRDSMIGVVPLVILGGAYFADVLGRMLEKRHDKMQNRIMAASAVLLILFVASFGYGVSVQRIAEMRSVKQFSPDYLDACKWMNDNLPPKSYTINLWGTPCQFYAPDINAVWTDMKELPDILFAKNDDKIIPLLERNGIGYIVIAKFSISDSNVVTSTPQEFVKYVGASDKFSLIYENAATLIYKVDYG